MIAESRSRTTVMRSLRLASTVASMLRGSVLRPTSRSSMVSGFTALPLNSGTERKFWLSITASSVSRDLISSTWLDISASMVMPPPPPPA